MARHQTLVGGPGSANSYTGLFENSDDPPDEFAGVQIAVLAGDPSKPGVYVVIAKWFAGNHFSHPHFHPHDAR